ncbi:hypothetical protein TNCV_1165671 [Trichonephila clavipes]|uniref:Uncharacterized protein n=1 Tax=Trichonephila clavipes TaxID=2585209 RepID=A0A8X6SWR6_TRICX|nr:hypothetical protein TNCV_1165671 [Trichonephila clavipes]
MRATVRSLPDTSYTVSAICISSSNGTLHTETCYKLAGDKDLSMRSGAPALRFSTFFTAARFYPERGRGERGLLVTPPRRVGQRFDMANGMDTSMVHGKALIDSYDFRTFTEKNEYSNNAYLFQDSAKSNFVSVRRNKLLTELECHEDPSKQWGYATAQEIAMFTSVTGKKQKNKFNSPTKDTSSAKKIKTGSENQFEILAVEDPPEDDLGDIIVDDEEIRSKTSTPVPHVRPPPPITIDNVSQPA